MRRIAILLAGATLVAGVASTGTSQRRPALPDSLTDREFWQLVTTWSEPGGSFPSENFVSNEKTYQYVIPELQRTLTPAGVYFGVGPEQNFTYIVNLKPRLAVIFDIRRQNVMLHLMYKALFELSPTRADFAAKLFARPLKPIGIAVSPDSVFVLVGAATPSDSAFAATWKAIVETLVITHRFTLSDDDLESMHHVLEAFREAGPDISYGYRLGRPPSPTQWLVTFAQLQALTNATGENMAFLATESNYRWLRTMERRNLVVPVVGDFAGPTAIRRAGDYVRGHGAVVTAFYVSNVEQYLFDGFGANERFYESVRTLPLDSTSMFIRTLPGAGPVPLALPASLISSALKNMSLRIQDSADVRILTSSGIDSSGQTVTSRVVVSIPPSTTANTSAFVTGLASIGRTVQAFVDGQLKTYSQVTALTKTEPWK